tara:strand:- start:87 stop:461 length:375 start_codon:yes stop_codon:yes gene_type:complete
MTDTKLLDSSIWLAYLFENKFSELIEKEKTLLLSALSIFEIKKKLLKRGIPIKVVIDKINYVKNRSIIIKVTKEISENAVDISIKNKMPMADSIIYITALENNSTVITLDNDFRNLEQAKVLVN